MIWVEVLSRQRQVISRQRFAVDEVHVGRSYANDLVLDDQTVAPLHAVIGRREDGTLVARNIGDAPGLFADGGRARSDVIEIDPDRPFRIGHTLLRIRTPAYDVARSLRKTAPLPPSTLQRVLRPIVAALILVATALVVLWAESITELRVAPFISYGALILGVAALWAGLWSLISRAVAGHWRFDRNFEIGAAAIVAYIVIVTIVPICAYALSWQTGSSITVVFWVLLGLALFAHLRAISTSRLLLKAAVVAALVLAVTAFDVINRAETRSISGGHAATVLMPPSIKLTRPRGSDAFFNDVRGMKAALEKAKRRPPGR